MYEPNQTSPDLTYPNLAWPGLAYPKLSGANDDEACFLPSYDGADASAEDLFGIVPQVEAQGLVAAGKGVVLSNHDHLGGSNFVEVLGTKLLINTVFHKVVLIHFTRQHGFTNQND